MQHFCCSQRWFSTDWSILFSFSNPISHSQSQRFPYDKQVLEKFLSQLPYESLLSESKEKSWKIYPLTDPVIYYRRGIFKTFQQQDNYSSNESMPIDDSNDYDSQLPPVIVETSKLNESNMRWEWALRGDLTSVNPNISLYSKILRIFRCYTSKLMQGPFRMGVLYHLSIYLALICDSPFISSLVRIYAEHFTQIYCDIYDFPLDGRVAIMLNNTACIHIQFLNIKYAIKNYHALRKLGEMWRLGTIVADSLQLRLQECMSQHPHLDTSLFNTFNFFPKSNNNNNYSKKQRVLTSVDDTHTYSSSSNNTLFSPIPTLSNDMAERAKEILYSLASSSNNPKISSNAIALAQAIHKNNPINNTIPSTSAIILSSSSNNNNNNNNNPFNNSVSSPSNNNLIFSPPLTSYNNTNNNITSPITTSNDNSSSSSTSLSHKSIVTMYINNNDNDINNILNDAFKYSLNISDINNEHNELRQQKLHISKQEENFKFNKNNNNNPINPFIPNQQTNIGEKRKDR